MYSLRHTAIASVVTLDVYIYSLLEDNWQIYHFCLWFIINGYVDRPYLLT